VQEKEQGKPPPLTVGGFFLFTNLKQKENDYEIDEFYKVRAVSDGEHAWPDLAGCNYFTGASLVQH